METYLNKLDEQLLHSAFASGTVIKENMTAGSRATKGE